MLKPNPNQPSAPDRNGTRAILTIIFALAVCGGLMSCALVNSQAENKTILAVEAPHDETRHQPVSVSVDAAQKREIHLQLVEVKRGYIHKTINSLGQVQPNAELSTLVSTPSAGRAMKVISRLGETVKEGDVMAVIKSDPIGQVQSDLLQNVLQAKADIKQEEVALKLDHITYDRESILFKEQVSAKADLQAAENALEKDNAGLAALKSKLAAFTKVAQERLTLLGAPPDSARKVIETGKLDPWVIIRAPRAGLVIERTINPGEMNDGSHQLFTLSDLSEVWLVANVFEKDVESVKKGQQAFVTLDSLPDKKFPAKIVWVGDTISSTTRTMPVRANVPNPEFILKPNMFARIEVSVGNVPVLMVPRTAVVQKGDESMVFVQSSDGKYQERAVTTGFEDAKDVEIRKGLSSGEMVVAHGGTELLGTAMKSSAGR